MFSHINKAIINLKQNMEFRKSVKEEQKEYKRYKTFTKADFSKLSDEKLQTASIFWIDAKCNSGKIGHEELLAALPLACQSVIAINAVDGEVNNGGFTQYYFNRSHILPVEAAQALKLIGAPILADIVNSANNKYIENINRIEEKRSGSLKDFMSLYENDPFSEYDTAFYKAREIEDLDKLLIIYIRKNINCFGD